MGEKINETVAKDGPVQKEFPEGMIPIGDGTFRFACHPGLSCFTFCCRRVDIVLYPYDIIRLKNRLGIDSERFLDKYTNIVSKDEFLPAVMLKMADNTERTCPFLTGNGCSIYLDRPTDCRTYPLERAVDRGLPDSGVRDYYFVHRAEHCLGHNEEREWTVAEWIKDQDIEIFNRLNEIWVEIDTLIREAGGSPGPDSAKKRKMAFMACYNLDVFSRFIFESTFLKRFSIPSKVIKLLKSDDVELLKFGVDWLRFSLGRDKTLSLKVSSRRI